MMKQRVSVWGMVLVALLLVPRLEAGPLEEAIRLYEQGVREYDTGTLERALRTARGRRGRKEYVHYLCEGLILHRLQMVCFINGGTRQSKRWGEEAERVLRQAEQSSPDSIEPVTYRGLVYLYLAMCGGRAGSRYGINAKRVSTVCIKAFPDHPLSRILDGAVALELPRALGGDPVKAVSVFTALRMKYADLEDVRVYLGKAYLMAGQAEQAFAVLKSVLQRNPLNRHAARVLNDVLAAMK
ncbi:MAG: hypothetical protein U9Q07_05290 [Planctomycetota bacterium]|nr:hypothetical protein [Planctomycetota bacterium]